MATEREKKENNEEEKINAHYASAYRGTAGKNGGWRFCFVSLSLELSRE